LIGQILTDTIGDPFAIVGQIAAVVATEHDRIIPVCTPLLSDAKFFAPLTIVESFLRFLAILKDQFSSPPFRKLPVRFLVRNEVADAIPIVDEFVLPTIQIHFSGVAEEQEEKRKREEMEWAIDGDLDLVLEEVKKWLAAVDCRLSKTDGDEREVPHPFGADGREVAHWPLAPPEFR
jgi:hypothetical protein